MHVQAVYDARFASWISTLPRGRRKCCFIVVFLPFRPATECGSASTSGIGAAVIIANTDRNLSIRAAKHYRRTSGLDRTRRGHRKTIISFKNTRFRDAFPNDLSRLLRFVTLGGGQGFQHGRLAMLLALHVNAQKRAPVRVLLSVRVYVPSDRTVTEPCP